MNVNDTITELLTGTCEEVVFAKLKDGKFLCQVKQPMNTGTDSHANVLHQGIGTSPVAALEAVKQPIEHCAQLRVLVLPPMRS